MPCVCAIVVTYQPDLLHFNHVLAALAAQVSGIRVVDNHSAERDVLGHLVAQYTGATLDALHDNLGIGAALNKGIRWATENGFDYVLLMDQDSVPTQGMVARLVASHRQLAAAGKSVAAIGPRFRDAHSHELSSHVAFGAWRIKRVDCEGEKPYVPVDYLITSGSLIAVDTLSKVGLMDEGLFIDHVDTEWTLRALSKGYPSYGDCMAEMHHELGEYRKRIWLFRWRNIPIHKPFRYYYIFRNSVLLYRRRYVPWAWRRVDMIRLTQNVVFMALFHPQRREALAMMQRGARDGWKSRSGRFPA